MKACTFKVIYSQKWDGSIWWEIHTKEAGWFKSWKRIGNHVSDTHEEAVIEAKRLIKLKKEGEEIYEC